jgi:hypothetical protein
MYEICRVANMAPGKYLMSHEIRDDAYKSENKSAELMQHGSDIQNPSRLPSIIQQAAPATNAQNITRLMIGGQTNTLDA